jgi:hypothetical protein
MTRTSSSFPAQLVRSPGSNLPPTQNLTPFPQKSSFSFSKTKFEVLSLRKLDCSFHGDDVHPPSARLPPGAAAYTDGSCIWQAKPSFQVKCVRQPRDF